MSDPLTNARGVLDEYERGDLPTAYRFNMALRALADEHERVINERDRYHLALQSLTPGGSEYHGDPARCVAYVHELRESQHRVILAGKKREKRLQAILDAERGVRGLEGWTVHHRNGALLWSNGRYNVWRDDQSIRGEPLLLKWGFVDLKSTLRFVEDWFDTALEAMEAAEAARKERG